MSQRQGVDSKRLPHLKAPTRVAHLVLLLAGALCVAGGVQFAKTVTSLHVLRTSARPDWYVPALERTADDAQKVQRLYATLLALPPPSGEINGCAADGGVVAYHLTFFDRGIPVLQATADPGGCRFVTLSIGGSRWAESDTFWAALADTLGVPESPLVDPTWRVDPNTPPQGPYAPTAVP
jgi:hypothetical protein